MKKLLDRWRPNGSQPKYTLEHLQALFNTLLQAENSGGCTPEQLVGTLREIAQLLIWGDQHDPTFFDFFLEHQILQHFIKVLLQASQNTVRVQIIQTLSMLVTNVSNNLSLYYLFSGNHINHLIRHEFDWSDEEVLSHYISFCKTIAMRLNPSTLQFFFDRHKQEFPLYTATVRFCGHEELLIRTHVRAIALNIFRIRDPGLDTFLERHVGRFFGSLCWTLRGTGAELDRQAAAFPSAWRRLTAGTEPAKSDPPPLTPSLYTMTSLQQEFADTLMYLNDIYDLRLPQGLAAILAANFLHVFLLPFLRPILDNTTFAVSQSSATFLLTQLVLTSNLVEVFGGFSGLLLHQSSTISSATDAASEMVPFLTAPPPSCSTPEGSLRPDHQTAGPISTLLGTLPAPLLLLAENSKAKAVQWLRAGPWAGTSAPAPLPPVPEPTTSSNENPNFVDFAGRLTALETVLESASTLGIDVPFLRAVVACPRADIMSDVVSDFFASNRESAVTSKSEGTVAPPQLLPYLRAFVEVAASIGSPVATLTNMLGEAATPIMPPHEPAVAGPRLPNAILSRLAEGDFLSRSLTAALTLAVVTSENVAKEVLEALNIVPQHAQRRSKLLSALTSDGAATGDGPDYPAAAVTALLDLLITGIRDVGQTRFRSLLLVRRLLLELVEGYAGLTTYHQGLLRDAYDAALAATLTRLEAAHQRRDKTDRPPSAFPTSAPATKTPTSPSSKPSSPPPKAPSPHRSRPANAVLQPGSPLTLGGPPTLRSAAPRSVEEMFAGLVDHLRPKFLAFLSLPLSALLSDPSAIIPFGFGSSPISDNQLPSWLAAFDESQRPPITELEYLEQQIQILQLMEQLLLTLRGSSEPSRFAGLVSLNRPPTGDVNTKSREGIQPCRVLTRSPDAAPFTDRTGAIAAPGVPMYSFLDGEYLLLVEPSPTVLHSATIKHAIPLFYAEVHADQVDPCRLWVFLNDCHWRMRQVFCLIYLTSDHMGLQRALLAAAWTAVWDRRTRAAGAALAAPLPDL
jgi:hypothetical protein